MRQTPPPLAPPFASRFASRFACLLSVLLASAGPAHAGTIEDFLIIGAGHTIAYSLPATSTFPDFPLFNFFSESAPATIDGVAGSSVAVNYYDPGIYPFVSLLLSLPPAIFGVSSLALRGQNFIQFDFEQLPVPPFTSTVTPTFLPGTYTEDATPPVPYTLTITPETAIAQTPEPTPLTLLATALCALALLARPQHRSFARLRGS